MSDSKIYTFKVNVKNGIEYHYVKAERLEQARFSLKFFLNINADQIVDSYLLRSPYSKLIGLSPKFIYNLAKDNAQRTVI